MTFPVTDHVPGFGEADMDRFAEEAAEGFDLASASIEDNPHFAGGYLPQDLLGDIDERARRDGVTREQVVRAALNRYLRSA